MIRSFEFADGDAEESLIAPEHVDFISLSRTFEETSPWCAGTCTRDSRSAPPGSTPWSGSSA